MAFPTYFHITARVDPGADPFPTRETCAALWRDLRAAFPLALAAVLMPTHLHLVTPAPDRRQALRRLGGVLSGFSREFGGPGWLSSAKQEPIATRAELLRQIRYVLLNPCRDRLVRDPLSWEWSTYRDVMGAAAPPWPSLTALQEHFGVVGSRFRPAFHAYVSGDPSVAVAGTPPPQAPGEVVAQLPRIAESVLVAMREPFLRQRKGTRNARRMVAHLATRLGLARRGDLTRFLGLRTRAVHQMLASSPSPSEERVLASAMNLLADPRYRLETKVLGKSAGLVQK